MDSSLKNIMIVGVGGQGTLLASRIIGNVAIKAGYDVKVSEVHGMSQRGGSVVTYVKYSKDGVNSPIVTEGMADIVLAFEALEAYRSIEFLKDGAKLIANNQKINPMPVITGQATYPVDIMEKIKNKGISLIELDALSLAIAAGNQKAVNVILIGVLAAILKDFNKSDWIDVMKSTVPAKFLDVNLTAFESGYALGDTY